MRWHYWLLTILYCATIFAASAQPSERLPVQPFPGSDKVVHAIMYGALAALVSSGMRHSRKTYSPIVLFWIPVAFAAFYGASDEMHQYFVPTRSTDFWDWLADTSGALGAQTVLYTCFGKSFREKGVVENGNDMAGGKGGTA